MLYSKRYLSWKGINAKRKRKKNYLWHSFTGFNPLDEEVRSFCSFLLLEYNLHRFTEWRRENRKCWRWKVPVTSTMAEVCHRWRKDCQIESIQRSKNPFCTDLFFYKIISSLMDLWSCYILSNKSLTPAFGLVLH